MKESRILGDSLVFLSRKINLEEEEDVGEFVDDSEFLIVEEFGRRWGLEFIVGLGNISMVRDGLLVIKVYVVGKRGKDDGCEVFGIGIE